VLQSMKPDARVSFPQSAAPYSEDLARAIIAVANDFAKGDATALRTKLAPSDQNTLDALVASGDWDDSVKRIKGVHVVGVSHSGPDSATATFGLAFQEEGQAYVVGFAASKQGSGWIIGGAAAPTETKPRASDFDGVSIGGMVSLSHADSAGGGNASEPDRQPSSSGSEKPAAEPAPSQPSEDQPEKPKPRRKMTPSGPVTIPGGG